MLPFQPGPIEPAGALSRRTFLTVSGLTVSGLAVSGTVASCAVLATGQSARAAGPVLSTTQSRMVLRVAVFGAEVPAPLPDLDEPGPAARRATVTRLAAVSATLPAQRLTLVGKAADSLVWQGLVDADDATMLRAIGQRAADPDAASAGGLVALVALAAATVTRRVEPTADDLGVAWLASMARLSASAEAAAQR